MNKASNVAVIALFALILIVTVSCSLIPSAITGLFATQTPTSTASSTSTPTATVTPIPPIWLTGCAFASDCPNVMSLKSFFDGEINSGSPAYVMFPFDQPVRISLGWTALNQEILDENLKHLKFFFTVDHVPYEVNSMYKNGFAQDEYGNLTDSPGLFMGVILFNWEVGIPHTITYGYVIDSTINDGWDNFEPQTVEYTIIAMPTVVPTSTPTLTFTPLPTATNTPKPIVYTPRPTSIPPTDVPSCDANSWIDISNTTGSQLTLYLSGPADYTFYIVTGDTRLTVCPGTYSYSAYGCGGASDTGVISSGEAHEFYCY